MKLVSIVVPAYDEAETFPLFYEQLVEALAGLEGKARFELLFVNNGSTDATLGLLQELRRRDPRVQIITLSRNFGYQGAIMAGLQFSKGDAVACIDADGEDPPSLLVRFVEHWLRGDADIVYGVRGRRPESALMQLARKAFYRVARALGDHEIVLDMAEFALMDRRVREAVLRTRSTFPFVRGQVGYVGFRRLGIPYDRLPRLGGQSHYNLVRAFQFGLGGILSSSTFPLRLLAYGAVLLVPLGLTGLGFVRVASLGAAPTGLLLLAGAIALLLLAWLVFAVGVIGIYLARVYKDQVALPLYVVDELASSLDSPDTERDERG